VDSGWKRLATTREEVGYVLLQSRGPDTPFRVVERHTRDSEKFDCLVTCMDELPGDDVFLREGNTFLLLTVLADTKIETAHVIADSFLRLID
jgi:hypothetical protein